ncbi:MAG: hypothetical protein IMZ62_00945 [Chloroflexi bacterium]|nr:hypothetical protein [Chloroflexota bacterium]
MRRGPWHQFGDRSQKLVLEQLQQGVGVGVVISPRDLSHTNAKDYAAQYHGLGAEVVIDQQFYVPDFANTNLDSYPTKRYRLAASHLRQLTDQDLVGLATAMQQINSDLAADALVAPALVYEAGRPDIVSLNARLFATAKGVGDTLGIPTLATVVLGHSVVSADQTVRDVLSQATSLNADGWYYAFEFGSERLPSSRERVLRCCMAGLTLACTGKPVLHAYAGPMGLLSLGFGATGAAIGHSQNLWHFSRGRWGPAQPQGGGGDAPARFFSAPLWGTIVHPDETAQLPQALRNQILSNSPFTTPWTRWQANKHLVFTICSTVADLASQTDPRLCAQAAISVLNTAVSLHARIAALGVLLMDGTNTYQANWVNAVNDLLSQHGTDFDYLDLLP